MTFSSEALVDPGAFTIAISRRVAVGYGVCAHRFLNRKNRGPRFQ